MRPAKKLVQNFHPSVMKSVPKLIRTDRQSVRERERGEREEEKKGKKEETRDTWMAVNSRAPLFLSRIGKQIRLSYLVGTFNNTFPPPLGTYVTFGFPDNDCTIALLASIFLNATNADPAFSSAFEIVAAASASPSARITAAWRSCSACSHPV